MSVILELRNRTSHAATPLIHPTSEHVVLAEVFAVLKNLPFDTALNPWLTACSRGSISPAQDWTFSFWEKQPRPVGVNEGSTEVDLVIASSADIIFVEAKMDAAPSAGTTNDPSRDQLSRNLDIGNRRALKEDKRFSLIYATPDTKEPWEVGHVLNSQQPFPTDRLFWSPWSQAGDVLAASVEAKKLSRSERAFVLDLLSYLAKKRLWHSTLGDDPEFYADKLRAPLRTVGSPFVPYAERGIELDQSWRGVEWDEDELRTLLRGLRWQDKALLKLLADAGGVMRQDKIMAAIPSLRGKTSASLRALKSHVNAACKGHGRAPILSVGSGTGDSRVHEINPQLGPLRQVVIDAAQAFSIPSGFL